MLKYRIEEPAIHIEEEGCPRKVLYFDSLKKLAREEDREGLSLLFKRPPSDTAACNTIAVTPEQLFQVIQKLSKTGRLWWGNTRLCYEARAAKVYWKGEKEGPLAAVLQWQQEEIPLEKCEGLFPGWAIAKGIAFPVVSQVASKWIQLFRKGPILLSSIQLKKFLEEEPPVLWKEARLKIPELFLTDATGCFANLSDPSWEADLIEAGYARKLVGHSHYYCSGDKVRDTLRFLLEIGWKISDCKGRTLLRMRSLEWDVQERGGQIAVRAAAHYGEHKVTLPKLSKSGLCLELDSSTVGLLEPQKLEGIWEEEALILPKSALPMLVPRLEVVTWSKGLEELALGFKGQIEFAPPAPSFRGTLLPYQQQGVDLLSFLHKWGMGVLLADEMGLGKTVQVLAFFSRTETNLPHLVVAPTSLLYQWKQECLRFLPHLSVLIYERGMQIPEGQGIVITSYATLRLDGGTLFAGPFDTIVLDESNAIKTSTTQTAQAAYRLNGTFKIALTGTPLENRPEEVLSQFRFLLPQLLPEKASLDEMKRKIRPFFLRRRKQDVDIQLPEKMEQIAWIEMTEAQKEAYTKYRSSIHIQDPTQRMEILEAILRLRQICADPRLVGEEIMGAKLEYLMQELADLKGHKVLIFSQFTSMLALIKNALREVGEEFLFLDGATPPRERTELVQRFQEEEISFFLLSLKAGGVGLNLTAADYVLLFDPWWNVAVEEQAASRAHRLGQKNKVIVKRYLTPDSIEEKMLRLKEEKQGLAEQLFEAESFSWTSEDLLHLLT